MKIELRYAAHPNDFKGYDTEKIRKEFLIEKVFIEDEISLVYSLYDRYMVGGAMPVKTQLRLESPDELKAEQFLDRREIGIIVPELDRRDKWPEVPWSDADREVLADG
jgi:4-deoxy-L-threo-5-hexosulose-uronate ketol-isomerase